MLTVRLSPDIERRLTAMAQRQGKSDAEFARELIEASLEDAEDAQMAVARLEQREPALTAAEARAALGLDR